MIQCRVLFRFQFVLAPLLGTSGRGTLYIVSFFTVVYESLNDMESTRYYLFRKVVNGTKVEYRPGLCWMVYANPLVIQEVHRQVQPYIPYAIMYAFTYGHDQK